MKVVCIADTHGVYPPVPDGDVLIHAGDITAYGKENELHVVNAWLDAMPHKHKIVVAGNDDWCFERMREVSEQTLSATYLHNSSVEIEGFKFYGSPYQPRFFDWAFNIDRNSPDLKANWELIPLDTDVLITHGPPMDILDTNCKGQHCGDELLAPRVKIVKPKHHVFGHIHHSHGEITIDGVHYVNASVLDDRYRPKFEPIVFELV